MVGFCGDIMIIQNECSFDLFTWNRNLWRAANEGDSNDRRRLDAAIMIQNDRRDHEQQLGSNFGAKLMAGCGDIMIIQNECSFELFPWNMNQWRAANEGDGGDRRLLGTAMMIQNDKNKDHEQQLGSNLEQHWLVVVEIWYFKVCAALICLLGIGICEGPQTKGTVATGNDWAQRWWYRMTGGNMSNSWAQILEQNWWLVAEISW